MIHILAHRGVWSNKKEQNTLDSFKIAFDNGWGIETDIRDFNGQLTVSHDPAVTPSVSLDDLITLHKQYPNQPYLALNIKADGLQTTLSQISAQLPPGRFAFFDMSVPQQLIYKRLSLPFLTRISEYEDALFEAEASGYWIDCFESNWHLPSALEHLRDDIPICLVSPELHGRQNHLDFWKTWINAKPNQTMICTDFPHEFKAMLQDKTSGY